MVVMWERRLCTLVVVDCGCCFVWVTVAVMTMVHCTPISVGSLSIGLGASLPFLCISRCKLSVSTLTS